MAKRTAAQLGALAKRIDYIRSIADLRNQGGTSFVICDNDGNIPDHPPCKRLLLIQGVPSGQFLPLTDSADVAPVAIGYRNTAKGVWQHRKIGIKMCRRYVEMSTPPEDWQAFISLSDLTEAPAPPAQTDDQPEAVQKDVYHPNVTAEEDRKAALALIATHTAASSAANAEHYEKRDREWAAIQAEAARLKELAALGGLETAKPETVTYRTETRLKARPMFAPFEQGH